MTSSTLAARRHQPANAPWGTTGEETSASWPSLRGRTCQWHRWSRPSRRQANWSAPATPRIRSESRTHVTYKKKRHSRKISSRDVRILLRVSSTKKIKGAPRIVTTRSVYTACPTTNATGGATGGAIDETNIGTLEYPIARPRGRWPWFETRALSASTYGKSGIRERDIRALRKITLPSLNTRCTAPRPCSSERALVMFISKVGHIHWVVHARSSK